MPDYKLSILVEGADRGAGSVLSHLTGGTNAFTFAIGNLISDGLEMAGRALLDFGASGLQVAADYESSLNMFQAVSGATGEQLAEVGDMAKALGADLTLPATSAGDAAKAMTELAKAGLSVEDAMAAAKGTLALSAAGVDDEARAAEIAANALNSFGLEGDKATMVADMFAAAANRSSVEVTDVADSFKMASAVFAAFQGPVVGSEKAMKDLTTAIAILGNVGIKGSDAGTSLKQMLLQLTGPSQVAKDEMKALMYAAMGASGGMEQLDRIIGGKAKDRAEGLKALAEGNPALTNMGDIAYDSAGNMRSLTDIIKLVSLATKDMSDEQRNQALTTIFGADATRAIIGLMRAGPEAFAEMETAISTQGAAADLAGARMKGLGGAWEGFQSTLETTKLETMEPLLGPLEGLVKSFSGALTAATPTLVEFVNTSLVPAVNGIKGLFDQFVAAPDKVAFIKSALADLGASFTTWIAPLTPIVQEEIAKLLYAAGTWIHDTGAPWLVDRLQEWAVAFVTWVGPAIGKLIVAAGAAFGNFLAWIAGEPNKAGISSELDKLNPSFTTWVETKLGPALGASLGALGAIVWKDVSQKWHDAFAPGSFGEKLVQDIQKGIENVWPAFQQWAIDHVTQLMQGIPGLLPYLNPTTAALADQGGVPGFAGGVSNFRGGMAMVGERGPELVRLPGGSDVIPMTGGGGGPTNLTFNIYDSRDTDALVRRVREELIRTGKRNNGNLFGGYA